MSLSTEMLIDILRSIQLANGSRVDRDRVMRMTILNLTQHAATAEQIAAGVVEPENKALVAKWLTFDELPSAHELEYRARNLAILAEGLEAAMLGGAPYLMAPLERALTLVGVRGLYAFSKRDCVEVAQQDGTVRKTQIFKHMGFIEAVH